VNLDQLYLLKPNFHELDKAYYCPGCAEVLGLLEFYPTLKQRISIHFVDYPRPRPVLVSLLGEATQNCPVLVLATAPQNPPAHLNVQFTNGCAFVTGARQIGTYLANVCGSGIPY